MAVENDFLAFAVGGSANVLTQAEYVALTSLLQNGFSSGIATSTQLNKVWRQSSIMAAVLAQFIVQQTGQAAIDDGTTATLLANLTAAVSANSEALIGSARNLTMSVTAASASATLTADEIIVGSALGGLKYTLPSFNHTINLGTTGAGGMDTGTAPVSGFVALYAIYNPTSGASALLATNATSSVAPSVYGGANMPGGYTASALVSVWPTNSSSQLVVGIQMDRSIGILSNSVLSSSTSNASFTPLSISAAVPPNAKSVSLRASVSSTSSTYGGSMNVASTNSGIGAQTVSTSSPLANVALVANMADIKINANSQTIQYNSAISGGTPTYNIQIYEYKF